MPASWDPSLVANPNPREIHNCVALIGYEGQNSWLPLMWPLGQSPQTQTEVPLWKYSTLHTKQLHTTTPKNNDTTRYVCFSHSSASPLDRYIFYDEIICDWGPFSRVHAWISHLKTVPHDLNSYIFWISSKKKKKSLDHNKPPSPSYLD